MKAEDAKRLRELREQVALTVDGVNVQFSREDALSLLALYDAVMGAQDKGPWRAELDFRQWAICSEDFTFDARLYLSGDFATVDDAKRYAEGIAAQLNAGRLVPDCGSGE